MRILMLLCMACLLPVQAFASCANTKEADALDMRALQSSLMVAAVSCDQQGLYNQFMKRYQSDIQTGGKTISSYFQRTYGEGYEQRLNGFITNLANEATQGSMKRNPDTYCDQTRQTFNTLLSLKKDEVIDFAEQPRFASLHGIRSCSG